MSYNIGATRDMCKALIIVADVRKPGGGQVSSGVEENSSAETVTEVRTAAERIRVRMKRTAEDIVAVGLDLIAIKERLPHGPFSLRSKLSLGCRRYPSGRSA